MSHKKAVSGEIFFLTWQLSFISPVGVHFLLRSSCKNYAKFLLCLQHQTMISHVGPTTSLFDSLGRKKFEPDLVEV
jgi:hypothetical protein